MTGISGFPKRESPYDTLDTGHSSTSISAGLGMTTAKALKGEKSRVISVIGDGSMTAGMAFEGLNQAGDTEKDFIVVLNDNAMSISPNVGAFASFLSRKMTGHRFVHLRKELRNFLKSIPGVGENILNLVRKSEDSLITFFTPGMLFEAFKFRYIGPIHGHRLSQLIETFNNILLIEGPVLVHVMSVKGKGYGPAEVDPSHFHGVGSFEFSTGIPSKNSVKPPPTYTEVFGGTMVDLGKKEKKLFAITAAMPEGTGLNKFAEIYPERFLDVGIAEQRAVTFAAGLALEGFRPVVAIYSTFLQRAFDQIVHDVCLSNLPVVFCIDRGGLVGEDGPTHHGHFDITYLRSLPNMIFMAPKDENELRHMIFTALKQPGPVAIRYPRGEGVGVPLDSGYKNIPIGQAESLKEGKDLVIIALGSMVSPSLEAASILEEEGISAGVVNCRFVKPLDKELVKYAKEAGRVLVVEENIRQGGLGGPVLEFFNDMDIHGARIKRIGLPDKFVEHGPISLLLEKYGLDKSRDLEGGKGACWLMSPKIRLDQLLVQRGLAESREKARGIIMAGLVEVNGGRVDKPGQLTPFSSEISLKKPYPPYVSRGGLKLEAALDRFSVDVNGRVLLDVGSSTGGFTDCLLKRGAQRVIAVDVGYGQLHWKLRQDPRVIVLEKTNIRYLDSGNRSMERS